MTNKVSDDNTAEARFVTIACDLHRLSSRQLSGLTIGVEEANAILAALNRRHDACSTFAERGAVEAAVAAERERCVCIVEDFTTRWGEHVLRRYLVDFIRGIFIFEKAK